MPVKTERPGVPIRQVLMGGMLAIAVLAITLAGGVGVTAIRRSVVREAQQRVNHNINTLLVYYEGRLARMAERIQNSAIGLALDDDRLAARLDRARQDLGLHVLNVCDAAGRAVAGQYPADDTRVPLDRDPVLRRALEGNTARGTVLLEEDRLQAEGGADLRQAVAVNMAEGAPGRRTTSALFWWAACPITDAQGRVAGLLYGGRALNLDFRLVDELRDMMFGEDAYEGKPLGTVTVFLDGCRVATNVRGADGRRALGTLVSDEVRRKVLAGGEAWRDRAWVVDAWYLSGYEPLRDASGRIVGMLYVGLLEAPYRAMGTALILRFLAPLSAAGLLAALIALFVSARIERPVRKLGEAANELARGDWGREIAVPAACAEIARLAGAFREMQKAVVARDRELRQRNRALALANERLERVNRNYMETLGFVSHELLSPLNAIHLLSNHALGAPEPMPTSGRRALERIRRNCEEVRDMAKNYLDLCRIEEDEMEVHTTAVDFRKDVVDPAVSQTEDLLQSRGIALTVACPEGLETKADAALMRIVLTNFLTNAAKYGKEGGQARLEVKPEPGGLCASLWNEGPGFAADQGAKLFQKFQRLDTEATRGRRGSGLGLFLCRHIMELHGGRVWAESEPGRWARFGFSLPD